MTKFSTQREGNGPGDNGIRRQAFRIFLQPVYSQPYLLLYFNVKAYLPVNESFDFTTNFGSHTNWQVFPQSMFDHWAALPGGSTLGATTKPGWILQEMRKCKGIKTEVRLTNHLYNIQISNTR